MGQPKAIGHTPSRHIQQPRPNNVPCAITRSFGMGYRGRQRTAFGERLRPRTARRILEPFLQHRFGKTVPPQQLRIRMQAACRHKLPASGKSVRSGVVRASQLPRAMVFGLRHLRKLPALPNEHPLRRVFQTSFGTSPRILQIGKIRPCRVDKSRDEAIRL